MNHGRTMVSEIQEVSYNWKLNVKNINALVFM